MRFLFVPRPKPNHRDETERQTVELGQSEIRKESLNLSNNAAAVCADPGRPGVDGSTIDGWSLGICRLFSFVLVF